MINKISTYIFSLKKYHRFFYYIIPILSIAIISFVSDILDIDKKVVNINRGYLWDMSGRPYEVFLKELNLPHSVGAVFVAGTPDNLEKTEKYYKKVNIGDIFTSQLRSFLYGKKITEFSIAAYINFVFGISAILFSFLVGYFIFKNGYISILVFLLIVIFRDYNQGLIYGLPLRHAYAAFNPLLIFCIGISIIIFFKRQSKKHWIIFILHGFIIAYIAHVRTSEGQIAIVSLTLLTLLIVYENLRSRQEEFKKILLSAAILLVATYAGYFGYQKMVTAFEHHRDNKLRFSPTDEKILSGQPAFHSLFISLFRYDIPNKFHDKTGYDAVYERYPEIKEKFSTDVNYVELANSEEYNNAVKKLYFEFIINKPEAFLAYLSKSLYDYFLFLPYYSWTGNKSAHAYLPKVNQNIIIETQDLAPGFKDTSFNWIVNLKLKYLPETLSFWFYFIAAYALLIEAVYASFIRFRINRIKITMVNEGIENNLPIYLLRGMLIYFFFASIVRALIPVHGQGAAIAFNIIIIYNLVRITASIGNVKINEIRLPAIKLRVWALLFVVIFLPFLTMKISNMLKSDIILKSTFDKDRSKWRAYLSNLANVSGGESGNCLQITSAEDATGYAYISVPTKIGETYKITAFFKRGSSPNGQIKVGASIDNPGLYYSGVLSDTDWTQYRGTFRAVTTTTLITLVNLTSNKGETSFFDSVTISRQEYYSE